MFAPEEKAATVELIFKAEGDEIVKVVSNEHP